MELEQRAIGNIPDNSSTTDEVKPFRTHHAFLIGINEYAFVTSLKTAVNDAVALGKMLEAQHNYLLHPILENPTKAALESFMNGMKDVVGAEDACVFYFAGHGIALEDDKGMNGYVVPSDAKSNERDSLVPMSLLTDTFGLLPCRHFLLILDCCFAGAIRWATSSRDVDSLFLPNRIFKERFERYIQDNAWQVLTSASYNQKAFDSLAGFEDNRDAQGDHSPFALALMEGLSGKGDTIPQDGGDGIITATELYLYLRELVELPTSEISLSLRQTPSIFTMPKHDGGEFIFFAPNHRLNLPPIPKRNPYKGLQSFDEADKDLFYGRTEVIKNLLPFVEKMPLTVVSGASGTGKSSLVKAGIIPKLRAAGYNVLPVIRPVQQAFQDTLSSDAAKNTDKLVLVIDQFEELLTQVSTDDRNRFIAALRAHIDAGLKVIVTVRSDFEPQFQTDDWQQWKDGRFIVPPFTIEDLTEVIVKPTVQEVLEFDDPDLVDQILQEVVQAPGALPLLSFTMSELYEMYVNSGRNDRMLTAADYKTLGGVIGSLRKKADSIYTSLDSAHQNSMRNFMLRMVSIGSGEFAGKRVLKTNLIYKNPDETKRIDDVVRQMDDARLVVQGKDNQSRNYVEPAHDALVRAWIKLSDWVKELGADEVSLQNKFNDAVQDYIATPDNKLLWLDDPRLEILKHQDNSWMNADEQAFFENSVKIKRRGVIIRIFFVALAFLLISIFATYAKRQQGVAEKNQTLAEKNALEAKKNADIASANEARALKNLKLYKSQEINKFIIDADTYLKSGHKQYAVSALNAAQSIANEYFADSTAMHAQIDKFRKKL